MVYINILYFCQLYPPAIYGGGEYIFFQWAKELVRRGHRVFTVTQRLDGTQDYEIVDGIDVYRVGPSVAYEGILSVNIRDNVGYILEATVKGMLLLSRNYIDLIHSNTYSPIIPGCICSTMFHKPHVVTFHDVYLLGRTKFWKEWTQQPSIPRLTAFLGPIFERFALMLSGNSIIHTVSETSKHDLVSCNVKAPIVVISNAVDMEKFDTPKGDIQNHPQAIYIGRLVFYKNLETVFEAFRQLRRTFPETKLIIVGDGPFREHLQKLAENLNDRIVFTGRVSEEEKLSLLKQSSFLVLPSLVEGFGIVILEAFACQKPALVSNIPPLSEIVEDGVDGFTIPPFESDLWAHKMLHLFMNPQLAHEMGLKGHEKLKRSYTIKRVADKLEEFYKSIISGRVHGKFEVDLRRHH
ncbi:glycosyltransferase family 4 protein [Candidatus Bathyarchaeota archaeon]|nr:glycosyltransferase family 4 protein [Candidatus Bathyarchaeota archaeon]